jgi:hypothetical protein
MTANVEKRPRIEIQRHPVLDPKTPGETARAFRERYYARPKRHLTHDASGFTVYAGAPGGCGSAVDKTTLEAQVYRFLEDGYDAEGEPFQPTPSRVRAVLWALAMQCHSVDAGGVA